MVLILKLSGILFGVLARTIVPYLRKVKQGKVKNFSSQYISSSIASAILGIIVTLLIFPQFDMPSAGAGLNGLVKLFCVSFAFGFGWNTIINEAAKWGGAFK